MADLAHRITDNVAVVRERIAAAAARSGRRAEAITLVAVTKYVDLDSIRPLVAAGCLDLGESRPQQLWQRAEELADLPVRWHMIGHLQRNKARRTAALATLIHSVDTPQLLQSLDEIGAAISRRLAVLLEVNVSGEAAKHGFMPEALAGVLDRYAEAAHLEIRGLMGMAALDGGVDAARRDFARLRQLRDQCAARAPAELPLAELSMGMSGDYEVAIEEGATLVRVGSALFEQVPG
jgi:hypothetical protein